MKYIRWFTEIGACNSSLVGGKGANLGELTHAGLPVPPGFCLTSAAYQEFIAYSDIDQVILECLAEPGPGRPAAGAPPGALYPAGHLLHAHPSRDLRRSHHRLPYPG